MIKWIKNWLGERRLQKAIAEEVERENRMIRCPTCKTTDIPSATGSNWGYVNYTCVNGHQFYVDVGDNFGM